MTAYAYNAWYPLAWSRDIGREIVARRVLEEDLAVYRTEEGAVAALEDACPHRLAPLSIGRLQGNAIQCGYHGLTFDCSGRCVHAPGMPRVPESFRVRSFPTAESMGMVWVWMGDAEKADRSQVFRLPQYDDPAYSVVEGDALLVQANYLSLADNLCDPTHVVYVHQTTLASAGREETRVQHERQGNKVVTWRWVIDGPLIPIFEGLKDFGGQCGPLALLPLPRAQHRGDRLRLRPHRHRCARGQPGRLHPDVRLPLHHAHRPAQLHAALAVPEELAGRPGRSTSACAATCAWPSTEDKRVLEAIQRNEDKPRQWHRINLGLDGSSIKMRRIVEEMAAPATADALLPFRLQPIRHKGLRHDPHAFRVRPPAGGQPLPRRRAAPPRRARSRSARSTATRPCRKTWCPTSRAGCWRRKKSMPRAACWAAASWRPCSATTTATPATRCAWPRNCSRARRSTSSRGVTLSHVGLALTDFAKQKKIFFLASGPPERQGGVGQRQPLHLPPALRHLCALPPR